ncbi:hypothetical protein O0L34_g1602 [Tuta absoluta]|nr:hypothetical protein O0L34_g1602 [Tuta absoluta]
MGDLKQCFVFSGGRSRAPRPERLDEEYYGRERYPRYGRDPPRERDYYHDEYGHEYPRGGGGGGGGGEQPYERDAYGHDYTRDAYERETYGRDYTRDGYARDERPPRRDRDPPDDYAPSRRALNAV